MRKSFERLPDRADWAAWLDPSISSKAILKAMHELAAYVAFSTRILKRPAVCKVRALEEDILNGSNAWHGQYHAQPRRA
jgi:hypothetical protein